jgi:pyruvate-formate lyase-activating enzyme
MPDPILLVADKAQNILDLPGYLACGQANDQVSVLTSKDLVPLPLGSNLFFLPDRDPVAFNIQTQSYGKLQDFHPVAAFLPPGYTQLLSVAYAERKGVHILPLFSYTPVAWWQGAFYVPAVRVDRRKIHDIHSLNTAELGRRIRAFPKTSNRLIRHLIDCALINSCPNAINFFLEKYECPLPVSPTCNARCMGCISLQARGSCPATQPRLKFRPTASEIAEVALLHIKTASNPIVSFGQGCEGEPLLAAKVMREAIRMIRSETSRGTIHMNTNASLTTEVEALCEAGLDSLRVSLNSVRPEFYQRYYSPRGYGFADVCRSIAVAKRHHKFVSLNYLVMPGFTDREDEFKELARFIRRSGVDMIQWRNLNYDPLRYFKKMKLSPHGKLLGVRTVIERMRTMFPGLRHGYYNVPKEQQ